MEENKRKKMKMTMALRAQRRDWDFIILENVEKGLVFI